MDWQNLAAIKEAKNVNVNKKMIKHNRKVLFKWDLITDDFFIDRNMLRSLYYLPPQSHFSQFLQTTDVVHLEDAHVLKGYLTRIYSSGVIFKNNEYYEELKYRIKRKDGRYIWITASLLTLFENGKPYMIVGELQEFAVKKALG